MAALLLLLSAPLLQGPSDKDLFDGVLNPIRATQTEDGAYGDAERTAQVLLAMALSPRAYRVDDGPFVRDAAAWLVQQVGDTPDADLDPWLALALAHVHRNLYAPTVETLVARHGGTLRGFAMGLTADAPAATLADRLGAAAPADAPRVLSVYGLQAAYAPEATAPEAVPAPPRMDAEYERGVDFLLAARGASGMWEMYGQVEPGISALAASALLGSPREDARAVALQVLDFLLGLQKPDGSIHGGHHAVYTTSVAIGALLAGGRDEDLSAVGRAVRYLRVTQADEGEGYSEDEKFYGGIGYGGDLRPDLSNLQFALQAMHDAGVKPEDDAFQRAVRFLERSQNRSESNTGTYYDQGDPRPVRAGDDGGATYYPGNSMAGNAEQPDGTLVARSYGSMTYALLKCYVFAGLDTEDPRVAAAVDWIRGHWTLEVNPGFDAMKDPRAGLQGLYYYYLSLAQALDAAGIEVIETVSGRRHPWRAELAAKLTTLQQRDGSWVNAEAPRWYEGNPVLCTAYVLNAIRALRGDE